MMEFMVIEMMFITLVDNILKILDGSYLLDKNVADIPKILRNKLYELNKTKYETRYIHRLME
jgi:hypothetical protein